MAHAVVTDAEWEGDPARRRSAWVAACVASTSTFLFVVDSGLIALSLPGVHEEFPGTARATLAWIGSGFLVAQSSLLLIGGRLGDRRGRKRYFLFGLFLFSLGALLTALAPTVELIIAARVLQGVGAAFLTSSALALVLPMFPSRMAPMVVGVWGSVGAVGACIAPTLGAMVIEVDWRWGFGIVAPIGWLAWYVGRRVLVEQEGNQEASRTDRVGLVLGPPALGLMMLVLSRGGNWGWGSTRTLVLGLVAVGLLVAFVRRCASVESPLLDLGILRTPGFAANVSAGFMQQAGFYSWFITAPLVMTGPWGWSVKEAGYALALSQILASVGSPVGGRLVGRWRHTTPIIVGSVINAAGSAWIALTATDASAFWTSFLPGAALIGFGGGMCGTVTTGAALAALPPSLLGLGNSTQQLIRRIGSATGVALGVALLGEGTGHALVAGGKRVWWLDAIAHVCMLLPYVWLRLRHPGPTTHQAVAAQMS